MSDGPIPGQRVGFRGPTGDGQALGVSTGGNTLGDTGTTQGTYVFEGINGITLSQITAPNAQATLVISGAGSGTSGFNAFGVSTGGNTAGNTGTTQGTYVLEASGNLTLSQITAPGNQATALMSVNPEVFALGVSTGGNTAGNTGTVQGTVVLVGSGAATLSEITAPGSHATVVINVQANTGSASGVGISAGTTSATDGIVVFADSNNVTFGMNGQTVTATVSPSFAISAGTNSAATGTVILSNSNGVTFGMNPASVITASISREVAIAAGTQTGSTGTILFSNSNGVTFGMSGSTRVTASVAAQSTNGVQALGVSTDGNTAGDTGTTLGTIELVGMGAATLSQATAAGSQATITISVPTGASATGNFGALAAGTQTATSGTVVFSNSNGVTFGMAGSTRVTASVQTSGVQALGVSTGGNTAGNTGTTLGTMVLVGAGAATLSQATAAGSLATITVSVPTGASATGNLGAIAAGTQTATSGTVVFSDSNGLTFGMNGSSQVTMSMDAIREIVASGSTATGSQVSFANSNGVTFGASGQTITASYTQSTGPGAIAAGTQTATSGTVVFSNSNAITFGMSGSTRVTASYEFDMRPGGDPVISATRIDLVNGNNVSFGTSGASNNVSISIGSGIGLSTGGNTSGTSGTGQGSYVFAGIGNITLSQATAAGASTLTISGSQSTGPGAIAAGTQTATSGTIVFSNSNNVTFGMSGSTRVTASANSLAVQAGTQTATSGTVIFSNSNGITFGMAGSATVTGSYDGVRTISLTQGTGTSSISASGNVIGLEAEGGIFFRTGGGGNKLFIGGLINEVIASSGTGAGGATSMPNTTDGNSVVFGDVSASQLGQIVFGMSTNGAGAQITASPPFVSLMENYRAADLLGRNMSDSIGSLLLQPFMPTARLDATKWDPVIFVSNSNNAGATFTIRVGAYTLSGSTASLASTGSRTFAYNSTLAGSSYTNASNWRVFTVPLGTWNVSMQEYMFAFLVNSTSALTNGTYSMSFGRNATFLGEPYVAQNYSKHWNLGIYSASTNNLPNSIQLSEVIVTSNSNSVAPLFPWFQIAGTF